MQKELQQSIEIIHCTDVQFWNEIRLNCLVFIWFIFEELN